MLSSLVKTTLASGELTGLYQDNLVDPSWDIRDNVQGTEGAWLSWTVLAKDGGLWYGSLAVTSAGVDSQQVWLSLRSSNPGWPWSD